MDVVVMLYPPVTLIGQPAPGAWPFSPEQKEVRFLALGVLMHLTIPDPETGQPRAAMQISGLGDWPLRIDRLPAEPREATSEERRVYESWRAALLNIQLAGANDPLLKAGSPGDGPGKLRRIQ